MPKVSVSVNFGVSNIFNMRGTICTVSTTEQQMKVVMGNLSFFIFICDIS